jgi:hypothetical protein
MFMRRASSRTDSPIAERIARRRVVARLSVVKHMSQVWTHGATRQEFHYVVTISSTDPVGR